jgi:hypothetical protein
MNGDPRPRSAEQNARMWAMLTDIANQVPWAVNGRLVNMPPGDWKDVLTASFKREQRIAAGIDGGFVMLGQRTSKMTLSDMSDLIELMTAFGSERGVKWTDPNEAAP